MPNVKTVSVTYGRKWNLGNYESATTDITIWADVEEGEDLDASLNDLWEMAKANVKAQSLPLVTKHKADVEEIYLGLPVKVREQMTEGGDNADQGAY